MLTKYVAVDLNRFGLNKHGFLSDSLPANIPTLPRYIIHTINSWTNDEKKATFYNDGDFAYKMAEFAGACQPHCVKVQFNWNN